MRLTGLVYRAHNPRWSFAPMSGRGAALYGGRFNPVGVDALYTSLQVETAWREAQQGFAFKAQPLTICTYRVDCDDIADLRDPSVQGALAIDPNALTCAWEKLVERRLTPPSWSLARSLLAFGVAGIIVPSFAPGARTGNSNVVVWTWSEARPLQVGAIDDLGHLPRNGGSWSSGSEASQPPQE